MVELDFNPQVGELVEVFPHEGRFDGLFEIVDRKPHPSGVAFDLKSTRDGRLLQDVATYLIDYPQDERIRRAVGKALIQLSLPEDFQLGKFDVKLDEMYDGTPRVLVNFFLKPEVIPSIEKAGEWREFYSGLKRRVEPFIDSSHWLQFAAKEHRSSFSASC